MAVLLDAGAEAVGSIKSWVRASSSYPIPSNWLIADGSVVADPDSPFNTQTLPDLRDKFEKGHPTLTNLNFGADLLYHTGGGGVIPSGGAASHALAHDHPGGSHTHGLGLHTHTISNSGTHAHTDSVHVHLVPENSHSHNLFGVTVQSGGGVNNVAVGPLTGTTHPSWFTSNGGGNSTSSNGDHSHGGATGSSSGTTSAATGNTDSALSLIDNQPPFLGLVRIVKIK